MDKIVGGETQKTVSHRKVYLHQNPLIYLQMISPISNDKNIKHYIYANDSAIAVQGNAFETIERKLSDTLPKMDEYFEVNSLRSNPLKTEV